MNSIHIIVIKSFSFLRSNFFNYLKLCRLTFCKNIRCWIYDNVFICINEIFYLSAEYILPCRKSDPQINTCIKSSFNHLRPYLGKGLRELNVPAMEPLRIEQIAMENNAGNIRIKALFSDVIAHGASNWTVRDVRTDIKVLKLSLNTRHFLLNL